MWRIPKASKIQVLYVFHFTVLTINNYSFYVWDYRWLMCSLLHANCNKHQKVTLAATKRWEPFLFFSDDFQPESSMSTSLTVSNCTYIWTAPLWNCNLATYSIADAIALVSLATFCLFLRREYLKHRSVAWLLNEKILKNLIKATAKECVTTHLPNELALKMDGAEADYLYSTSTVNTILCWVGRRGVCGAFCGVSRDETDSSADLGSSSKYSNENFEDWSGERFHVISN